jgi:hypothetical protein
MKKSILSAFAALISLTAACAWAAPAGQITHLSGILSVKKADGTAKILSVKSEVQEGDLLSTEDDTYARIKFADGGEVVLRPNSQLKVESYSYDEAKPQSDNVFMNMLKGGLRAVTGAIGKRNKEKIAYQTPTATIGIRGTHFGALFCQGDCGGVRTPTGQPPANGLHVDVSTGAVSLTNSAGTVTINQGQFAFVQAANVVPQPVPRERAVRVTMPDSISKNKGGGDGIGKGGASDCAVE